MKELIKLCRPEQYYKNLVIFLHILFSQQITNVALLGKTIEGFIILCLVSSINYIINDLKDKEKDKLHPEKIHRPLASGTVSATQAIFLIGILTIITIVMMTQFTIEFNLWIGALFFLTQAYTFIIKKIPYADVLIIASNFVIRTLAGVFINGRPEIHISPWLILCPFFLAMFLASGKRLAEMHYKEHRETLKEYTQESIQRLHTIAATLLIMTYSLYIILAQRTIFLITLPCAIYTIFRYTAQLEEKRKSNTLTIMRDKPLILGAVLWFILIIVLLYII